MSNTEINRQIVQEGLDRRAEQRKQMEASLEDQARMLRHTITDNHITKRDTASLKKIELAAEQARQKAEKKAKYEAMVAAEQAAEKKYCAQFLARAFTPMILATVCVWLFLNGNLPMLVAIPAASILFAKGFKYMLEFMF